MSYRTLTVDAEFEALVSPLQPDERLGLEESLLAHGCRDALVVWKEEGILVDGHNRYAICREHGIAYRTRELSFPDRESAADWIDANQLARRNLSPDQISLLRGRRYNRAKKARGGDRKSAESKGQNDPLIATADKLAKQHGVSAATIKRDGKFADGIEKAKAVAPDIERQVAKGGASAPTRKKVIDAAKIVEKEPERARSILIEHATQHTEKPKRAAKPPRTQADAFDEFTVKLERAIYEAVQEFPDIRQSIKSHLQLVCNRIKP